MLFHCMNKSNHNPVARCAYRMAETDTVPVHIRNLTVDLKLFLTSQVLGCKSLVQLDKLKVFKPEF